MLCDVRNLSGRLVFRIDDVTGDIELIIKDDVTRVIRKPNGEAKIIHSKNTV